MASPQFGRRSPRAMRPEQYLKAADEIQRCLDRIRADAAPKDSRSKARRSSAVQGAFRASEALFLADRGTEYCERCESYVVARHDDGDLLCPACSLLL